MKVYPLERYEIHDLVKDYFYLCNFYMRDMEYNDRYFTNAEAAYQAEKCRYDEDKDAFALGGLFSDPRPAREHGQEIPIVDDWDDIRVKVMYDVIKEKFLQNPDISLRLLKTRPCLITEGDRFGDTFWGLTKDGGENHLGNILMYIRDNVLSYNPKLF